MPPTRTLQTLLAAAQCAAAEQEQEQAAARIAARCAWVEQTIDAYMDALKRVDEAWTRIFDALPDDIDDDLVDQLPSPPEQAEADALFAQIEAVRDHDRGRGICIGACSAEYKTAGAKRRRVLCVSREAGRPAS